MSGIDAPEKGQPFGSQAKESLSEMVFNKQVVVESDKKDRYRRNVGKVHHAGTDVNLEQVKRGMAWHTPPMRRSKRQQTAKHMRMLKQRPELSVVAFGGKVLSWRRGRFGGSRPPSGKRPKGIKSRRLRP
ncbi:MAG: thermonuclease family protein [Polaromonas sp.]|nr:thermonuclease family protein [Polaromonas sp.]